MRSAVIVATCALAMFATSAPVPETIGNSVASRVFETDTEHATPDPIFSSDLVPQSIENEEPDTTGETYTILKHEPSDSRDTRRHDSRSPQPEPFTRNHGSYRKRTAEPEPFTRNHGSYRTRNPEPEPAPEAKPIYKSNGRSTADFIATRSPALTRPKNPRPQDTEDETESSETSNAVEARAGRDQGQAHGPKHKGGRSAGRSVDVQASGNTGRSAEPEPSTRGGKPGGAPGNRGGRGSNRRAV